MSYEIKLSLVALKKDNYLSVNYAVCPERISAHVKYSSIYFVRQFPVDENQTIGNFVIYHYFRFLLFNVNNIPGILTRNLWILLSFTI